MYTSIGVGIIGMKIYIFLFYPRGKIYVLFVISANNMD